MKNQCFIFSAPSGSGKSTIVNRLLNTFPSLSFSISATSRAPRGEEKDGVEYHFFSPEEFKERIAKNELVEYEEVYTDKFYGTLKSELQRIWDAGKQVVFDVDVVGGVNLKKLLGDNACSIFIQPPSVEELERRLKGRGTDTDDVIQTRIDKAAEELTFAPQFDHVVLNDELDQAVKDTEQIIQSFLN